MKFGYASLAQKRTLGLILGASLISACTTTTDPYTGQQQTSKTAIGAGIGAGVGALGGLIVSKSTDSDWRKGVLIGAGVGALTGGVVGNYMDRQEAELRQQLQGTGVSVTRVGNQLILNMPSNVTFASGESALNAQFFPVLNSVALILKRYDRSLIDVAGHTDSVGSEASNQTLSEQRAMSVAQYINSNGVDGRRMRVQGFGESRPIADNNTDFGRAQNRRVELQISPLM